MESFKFLGCVSADTKHIPGFPASFCLFLPLKTHIHTHFQLVLAPETQSPCNDYVIREKTNMKNEINFKVK